jgi:hypothetical protein
MNNKFFFWGFIRSGTSKLTNMGFGDTITAKPSQLKHSQKESGGGLE